MAVLCVIGLCTSRSKSGASVSIDGSTSMEKVIGALGESFMAQNSGVTFTYNPTGSGSGIKAVEAGTDEEKAAGLTGTVLAYDGIAMIVNNDNPVEDLTLEQVAAIYTARSPTGARWAAKMRRLFSSAEKRAAAQETAWYPAFSFDQYLRHGGCDPHRRAIGFLTARTR